jgi:hypothetical protein
MVAGTIRRDRRHPELVETRGIHDLAALYFAAIGGDVPTARKLIEAGAGVNDHAPAAGADPWRR